MHGRHVTLLATAALTALWVCNSAAAQLAIQSQFAATGGGIGLAYDHTDDSLWRYTGGATIQHFTLAGAALPTIPRPGASANDADLEVTTIPLTLATTPLPAGTLLFVNGESGTADIYALDKATGAVLATLVTSFGASHVVGGAVHPNRGTIFLVQDRVASDLSQRSRVAEINPQTGAVLNTFQVTTVLPSFTVNYGDIEVAANGNLLIVSDDESSIAELTPTGALVQQRTLPVGVTGLCGIGVDEGDCELWVASTSTGVWRLSTVPGDALCLPGCSVADVNNDGLLTPADIATFVSAWSASLTGGTLAGDFDRNGVVNPADIAAFVSLWFASLSEC